MNEWIQYNAFFWINEYNTMHSLSMNFFYETIILLLLVLFLNDYNTLRSFNFFFVMNDLKYIYFFLLRFIMNEWITMQSLLWMNEWMNEFFIMNMNECISTSYSLLYINKFNLHVIPLSLTLVLPWLIRLSPTFLYNRHQWRLLKYCISRLWQFISIPHVFLHVDACDAAYNCKQL